MNSLINTFIMLASLSTATGVFVHDTRLDKAAVTVMDGHMAMHDMPLKQAAGSIAPELHPHVERGSLAVSNLKTSNPSIQPRTPEDKRHLLQKRVARGHHPFDSYSLPVI